MATTKVCDWANGTTRYTVIVRLCNQGKILHHECRMLAHPSAALNWAKHREVALDDPAELTRHKRSIPTLAELIRCHVDTFESISRWQRCKQTHLEFMEHHALSKTMAHTLADQIVKTWPASF